MIPATQVRLPTHKDLPHKDNIPVDNLYQPLQGHLLTEASAAVLAELHPTGEYLVGQDNGIYYRITEPPLRGCLSPDWYYVPGVPQLLDGEIRLSYVLWQEHQPPAVVVELASGDGTAERDDTPEEGKFWVYERAIRVPYYVIYDFEAGEGEGLLEVHKLVRGRYVQQRPNAAGRYSLPPLKSELGLWYGRYSTYDRYWLRLWDETGELRPTAEELAETAQHAAERERQRVLEARRRAREAAARADEEKARAIEEKARADEEKARADRLAAMLRQMGVDPEQLK